MMLLTGCQGEIKPENRVVPAFPKPTAAVGREINPYCFPVVDKDNPLRQGCIAPSEGERRANCCPALKSWTGQLMKYEAQIDVLSK